MRSLIIGAAAAASALSVGCGGREQTTTPPLPHGPPLALEPLVAGLTAPVQALAAPADRRHLYVVEQRGLVRAIDLRTTKRRPFIDLRDETRAEGERGLFAIAFHPDWPRRRAVYASYTNRRGDSRVTELTIHAGRIVARRDLLVLEQPYENHNGGFVAFGPDRLLYLGLGDGGHAFDPERRAQNPRQLFGKLLRLDVDDGAADWETVAVGLRNPWRFAFDAVTGDLWIGDVGQDLWEEVDVLRSGTTGTPNFGWDVYEGRERVEDHEPSPRTQLVWPTVVYGRDVGCSVIGGRVFRGADPAALRGRYVYGDWCSGRLWSVRTDGSGARVERPRVRFLTSFGVGPDGRLLAVSGTGTVYRLRAGRT